MPEKKYIDYAIPVILSIISICIIFNNLGSSTFFDWDESHYGEVALEILKSGDWIVLTYGGQPDLIAKPPLGTWLMAISFKIFGVTEFALRFWSAFFGAATILLVYYFGKEIENRCTGIYAALFLLTTTGFIGYHGARTGDYDAIFAFFITLSLYFFYLSLKRENRKFLIGTFAAMALAVLVKGVIGLFPLIIIGIYLLYFGNLKETFFKRETYYAIFSFCLLVFPLFAYRFIMGAEYFKTIYEYDMLKRFIEPVEGHVGDASFYFSVLYYSFGQILFLLIIVVYFYSTYLMFKKNKPASLLIIWISIIFIFFTVARTKIFWYIMPIYPALSLLTGYNADILQRHVKIEKKSFFILVLIFMIIPVLSIIELTQSSYIEPQQQTIKELKSEIGNFSVLYIHSDENRQSIYLYLNSFVKDKVIVYSGDINNLNTSKGDGIITFSSGRFNSLSNDPEYELIKTKRYVAIFKKV